MTGNDKAGLSTIKLLRYAIGGVYLWFGALKFFYGFSPAEQVARLTIRCLTFGLLPDRLAILMLAIWECSVGILLLARQWTKPTLVLLFIHLGLTFSPFLLFPHQTFQYLPYSFTLLGQYIFKNIIVIAAARVIWQAEDKLSYLGK